MRSERLKQKQREYAARPEVRERRRAQQREYRKKPGAREKRTLAAYRSTLKTKYGLSLEDFEAMRTEQQNRCAVCLHELLPGMGTHVDHDHDTGKVRALLCHNCNVGLGLFSDSPEVLKAAIIYLERHKL